MDLKDIEELFASVLSKTWGYKSLRKEQVQLIHEVLKKTKVSFGILPTGYGKSDIYAIPPLLLDQIEPEGAPHVALVISPLRSLMIDQVKRWRDVGLKCAAILKMKEMPEEDKQAILRAEASIVFTSPEAIMSEPWRSMLRTDEWVKRLCLVCCDEAHCLHDWGLDFRPAYKHVAELRGVAKTPWLLLTATCNVEMLKSIKQLIGSPKETTLIAQLPDRPNIFLQFVGKAKNLHQDLRHVAQTMKDAKEHTPKTIIYCSNTEDVCDIFDSMYRQLGDNIYLAGRDREKFGSLLAVQYHRGIGPEMEKKILEEFVKPESTIRVLISTVAFGMGVQIPDIHQVIHWGLSSTVASYWQEVGRCGRDGKKANATLYAVRVDERYSSKEMCDLVKKLRTESGCFRKEVLQHFVLPESSMEALERIDARQSCANKCEECTCNSCSCCSLCRTNCECRK